MWYTEIMEYYSTAKITKLIKFSDKWMDRGKIILSEVNQTQKGKCCIFSLTCNPQVQIIRCKYTTWSNHRNQETRKRPQVGRESWKGNRRKTVIMKWETEQQGEGSNWGKEGGPYRKTREDERQRTPRLLDELLRNNYLYIYLNLYDIYMIHTICICIYTLKEINALGLTVFPIGP